MKKAKILFAVLGSAAALGIQAFAGDAEITLVSNGHGQQIPMYRSSQVNLALYEGGNTVGSGGAVTIRSMAGDSNTAPTARMINRDSGHGQQIPLFY